MSEIRAFLARYLETTPEGGSAESPNGAAARRALKEWDAIEEAARVIVRCWPCPYSKDSERGRIWYPAMDAMRKIVEGP